MSQILVVPHGNRWAVKESPEATPIAEYETCELAELAARGLAAERGGWEVVVDRSMGDAGDVPENVHPEEPESELARGVDPIDVRMGDTRGAEEPRVTQAGL